MNRNRLLLSAELLGMILCALWVAGCSTTSNLPEGDILYTGIKRINVHDQQNTYAESVALTEVEAALAYAPNNSFMGSSSLRMPPPVGLWIYNAMVNKEETSGFSRWMLKTFGSTPVTISAVNPKTRVLVATNTLQNYGYFNGYVDYELLTQKDPKKQKIQYDIHLGQPYVFDSIRYAFRGTQDSIVQANLSDSYLHTDAQFSVPDLQLEKDRLNTDFRNNGYYYYRTDYIRYYADSMQIPQRVKLLVQPDMEAPARANRQWYIGNVNTYIRNAVSTSKQTTVDSTTLAQRQRNMQVYDDSVSYSRGRINYAWQGEEPPVKLGSMLKNYQFHPGQLFSQEKVSSTTSQLSNLQTFSSISFTFTPRDTTSTCDTLDVKVLAVMDKLYDVELEAGFTQKSNSQIGPNAKATISKRNAFGRGEVFSVSLRGSYEWQTGNRVSANNSRPDSWEAALEASLTQPWLQLPWGVQRRLRYPASTTYKVSIDNLKRAGYYRLVSFGAEFSYNLQTSAYVTHQFTPLSLTYNKLMETSERFDSITASNPALYVSMRDQFIPAIQYTYTYDNSSNTSLRKTTRFTATIKESANIISAVSTLCGSSWSQEDKKIFGTPYSQFLKLNAEMVTHFHLTDKSELVTRLLAGAVFTYGNSSAAPYSELLYVGGANSIRAFAVRAIGPGTYVDTEGRGTYLDQAGDFRLEANVEYRFPLVSNLYGALFLDAGNVWLLEQDDAHPGGSLSEAPFFKSIALGTGLGFRYDMEFLVLRLDFGVGIHAPYETGKSGYYNIPKFWDSIGFHFAVGYPF